MAPYRVEIEMVMPTGERFVVRSSYAFTKKRAERILDGWFDTFGEDRLPLMQGFIYSWRKFE